MWTRCAALAMPTRPASRSFEQTLCTSLSELQAVRSPAENLSRCTAAKAASPGGSDVGPGTRTRSRDADRSEHDVELVKLRSAHPDGNGRCTAAVARALAGRTAQLAPASALAACSSPSPSSLALDLCKREGRSLQRSREHACKRLLRRQSLPGKVSALRKSPDRNVVGPSNASVNSLINRQSGWRSAATTPTN